MTQSLVEGVVDLVSYFPPPQNISDTMIPLKKSGREAKIDLKSSNTSGGAYFMSLYKGKRLQIYIWEEISIYTDVIR